MLRLRGGRVQWGERHTGQMQHIVGVDAAVAGKAPALASILKVAAQRGIPMDRQCRVLLERTEFARQQARQCIAMTDSEPIWKAENAGWPHQRVAVNFTRHMTRLGPYDSFLVTDATGVGKTWEAIIWAKYVAARAGRTTALNSRILVVTKNIAKDQWADAIRRYVGTAERIRVVDGTKIDQARQAKTKRGWVIAHWESLSNIGSAYLTRPWDAVILDEAHYINNRKAQRSGVIFRLKKHAGMALTAHPFDGDDPGQLFSILRFLYPKTYTSYWRFFHMHVKATPKQWGGFETEGPRRPKLLQWEIAPYTISRRKEDVFKSLPRITRRAVRVSLTTRGLREYDRLRKQLFAELDGMDGNAKIIPIINDLSRLTRVRQYLIDPGLIGGRERSVKYPAIHDLMEEIQAPLVVFTEFKQAALRLAAFLRKEDRTRRMVVLHGGMKAQVPGIKKRFLAGNLDVIIAVSKAANEAVNFGKYGYVAHLDLPWRPRELEQAEGRVDRPEEHTGKIVPTTAWRVVVKDSYEERMEQRLTRKHSNFNKVFTVNSLRELFT
jgi:SNF2-related domain/Helicase conserved C-terminal domain